MMVDKFNSAIFFDNDQGYLDDVKIKCPGVQRIKVNEIRPLRTSSLNSGPLKNLMDSLHSEPTENSYTKEQNSYVRFLRDYKHWVPSYYPESGIQHVDIQKYYKWFSETTGNRILLLDWDLTLSMFDGIDIPHIGDMNYVNFFKKPAKTHNNFFSQAWVKPKDVAVFYLGGKERFRMITEWLKDVANSGIHIAVLTNNTGSKDTLFKQIVAEIIPKGAYEIISSYFPPYNGDKGKILADDPRFERLCPKIGGKRKQRKTRQYRK